MIPKKDFIEHMTSLKKMRKAEEKLREAISLLDASNSYVNFGIYENMFIRTMKFALEDKWSCLSYWVYDCDMGTNKKLITSVKDGKGKKVKLTTLSELYDFISKENKI